MSQHLPQGDCAIYAEDLGKSYGPIHAVDSVSFSVTSGEVFGIVGANGAGKSSVLKMVANLIRPDKGSIQILGQPLNSRMMDRIGYLPEERGIYTRARVGEVIEYFARLKNQSARSARMQSLRWLERFDLTAHAGCRVDELSKGNQQKVQLSAVLAGDPQILVLDEPMSGLDPITSRSVVEVIRELAAGGRTILLSTHDLHQIESLCGRVMMIHRGRRVLYGEIAALRRKLSDGAIRIGSDADLDRCPFVLSATPDPAGARVLLRPGSVSRDLLDWIHASNARVWFFEEASESMEMVFMRTAQNER